MSLGEAAIHTLLVITSFAILMVSIRAYSTRGGRRYLALTVAFVFLALSQVVEFLESYFINGLFLIPILDVHLSHLLDLAMLASFGAALLLRQERIVSK